MLAAPFPSHAQAILSLDAANSLVRGSTSTIVLNVSVKAKAVSFHRLYVKVRCKEFIDLTYSLPDEKDEKGKKTAPGKTISVKREEILFEKKFRSSSTRNTRRARRTRSKHRSRFPFSSRRPPGETLTAQVGG
jgi:hypothetical protein